MRQGSLLGRLFWTLAVLVGVPVVIMITMSDLAFVGTTSEELGKASLGKLRVAASIDRMVDELVHNTCVRIALDETLASLAESRDYRSIQADGSLQYAFMSYQDSLGDLVRTNPLFHSIHLVLDDADWVLSTVDGTVPKTAFSDRKWLFPQIDGGGVALADGAWVPHRAPTVMGGAGVSGASWSDTMVLSRFYRLTPYVSPLRGWVVVNLHERELSRRINSSNYGDEGAITLLGEGGTVISAVDPLRVGTDVSGEDWYGDIAGRSVSQGWMNGTGTMEGHLVSWYRNEGDWRMFVGDFSLEDLMDNAARVRLIILGLALVVLGAAMVVSWFLSRTLLNPLRTLARDIMARAGYDPAGSEENELSLLSKAVDTILRRDHQYFSDLEAARREADELWLARLYQGRPVPGQVPAGIEGRPCMAGILAIDGKEAYRLRVPAEQREYLGHLLAHMVVDAFKPWFACVAGPCDEERIVLVLAQEVEVADGMAPILGQAFERIQAEAARVLGTTVSLGLGTLVDGPGKLAGSMEAAGRCLARRFVAGPGLCHCAMDLEVPEAGSLAWARTHERRILAGLEDGNRQETSAGCEELAARFRAEPRMNPDQARLVLVQILAGMVRLLLERTRRVDDVFGHRCDPHAELARCETVMEALAWLRSAMERMIAAEEALRREEPDHGAAILAFIHEHYRSDFGIDAVADHLGLSYSHVRKVFHDLRGESIVDYVNSLRIAEARRLLRETDLGLAELAALVGYNNCQGLNRHFKRETGMTPGEYRLQHQGTAQIRA